MATTWLMPTKTRAGKPIDVQKYSELIRYGVDPEDVANIILGAKKYITTIDRILYTPLTEEIVISNKRFNLSELQEQFYTVITALYRNLDEELAEIILEPLSPQQVGQIKSKGKNDDALTFKKADKDFLVRSYTLTAKLTTEIFSDEPNIDQIKAKYSELVDYLSQTIEDPNPTPEMANMSEKMSLMAVVSKIDSLEDVQGSKERAILEELLEPTLIHPSIKEIEYEHVRKLDPNYRDSVEVTNALETVTSQGEFEVHSESMLGALKNIPSSDEPFDFISGGD